MRWTWSCSMDNRAGLIIGSIDQACFVYIGLQFSSDSLSSSLVLFLTWLLNWELYHLCYYWTLCLVVATTMIFLDNVVGNTFLIWIMSLILIFEVCVYNILLLFGKFNLLSFDFERASGFAFRVLGTVGEFLVKCDTMYWQNVLLFLFILRQSQPDL